MASVNKVTLIGNLGQTPELKQTQGGKAVANLSVATSRKVGEVTQVEWHRVVVWDKTAENCVKFLQKGSQVYIEGRLQTRSYEKDGEKRYQTDIVAEQVVFLGSTPRQGQGSNTAGVVTIKAEEEFEIPF